MTKKLVKNDKEKMLGGVVAGIADYFKQDPTVWRVGVVLLAVLTGLVPILVFYFVAWFVMPGDDAGADYTVVD